MVTYFDDSTYKEDADLWYYGPGWYFIDEIGSYNGPYDSESMAINAIALHAAYILDGYNLQNHK